MYLFVSLDKRTGCIGRSQRKADFSELGLANSIKDFLMKCFVNW